MNHGLPRHAYLTNSNNNNSIRTLRFSMNSFLSLIRISVIANLDLSASSSWPIPQLWVCPASHPRDFPLYRHLCVHTLCLTSVDTSLGPSARRDHRASSLGLIPAGTLPCVVCTHGFRGRCSHRKRTYPPTSKEGGSSQ